MLNNVENLNQYKSTKESFVTKISLAKEVKSTKYRPQQRQSVAHAHSISEKSKGDYWILFTWVYDSPCSVAVFPKGKHHFILYRKPTPEPQSWSCVSLFTSLETCLIISYHFQSCPLPQNCPDSSSFSVCANSQWGAVYVRGWSPAGSTAIIHRILALSQDDNQYAATSPEASSGPPD